MLLLILLALCIGFISGIAIGGFHSYKTTTERYTAVMDEMFRDQLKEAKKSDRWNLRSNEEYVVKLLYRKFKYLSSKM